MKDQRHLLKIKLKSLAAEAVIIREAENRRKVPRQFGELVPDPELMKQASAADVTAEQRTKLIARAVRVGKAKRRAEFRAKPWFGEAQLQLDELHLHRVRDVREASRAGYLAYGFMRGRTLHQLEGVRALSTNVNDRRVYDEAERLARKYGPAALTKTDFRAWMAGGSTRVGYKDGWPCLVGATAEAPQPDTGDTALAIPDKS